MNAYTCSHTYTIKTNELEEERMIALPRLVGLPKIAFQVVETRGEYKISPRGRFFSLTSYPSPENFEILSCCR
jgi:hypothetical protein